MTTICIDGYNLAMPRGSGIATYGRNLLLNLRDMGLDTQVVYGPQAGRSKIDMLNEIALTDASRADESKRRIERQIQTFTGRYGRKAFGVQPSGDVIWPARSGGQPAASAFWSAPRLFDNANRTFKRYKAMTPLSFYDDGPVARPDMMHWTTVLPVHVPGKTNIYTIHDLIPLRLPHATLDNKRQFLRLCKAVAKKADHIAVVSEATRNDVIRILGVSPDRVTNTYQSVSVPKALTDKTDTEIAAEVEGIFNLGFKEYYLYFGAIEPKKNLGRIVEAYLASGSKRPLVVIGGRAWLEEDETALMAQSLKHRPKDEIPRIRQYDFMPFAMLVSLIQGARATLFPSLYEGFGLPVLESMLLGTPVLTSTAASLPEVAGEAALMVDPYDTPAITSGIRTLDADDDTVAELIKRGRVQAERFSPQAYQMRLASLYKDLGAL